MDTGYLYELNIYVPYLSSLIKGTCLICLEFREYQDSGAHVGKGVCDEDNKDLEFSSSSDENDNA